MSARPRPVTATFMPSYMDPVTSTPKHRHYSLSSGTSTESLISILDHDSYESPPDSDVEDVVQAKEDVKEKKTEKQADESFSTESKNVTSEPTTTVTTEKHDTAENLSPWEKWLIRKTKEVRLKEKQEQERKQKQEEEEKRKREERIARQKETEVKINNWIERQNTLYKVKLKEQKIKENTEKEVKEEKRKQIEEKSKVKYQEWQNKKHNEMMEKKKAEKEKKKEELEKKAEKEKKNQAAFDEWCKNHRQRRKSTPQSFGYTEGKLTGYHDTNAYPVPSFYNPIPWQPIHVPQPKNDRLRKKKLKKYAWNPKKYL